MTEMSQYVIKDFQCISKISLFISVLVFALLTLAGGGGGTSIKFCFGF